MDNQKFNLILDGILKRTEEGKLEWKTTADNLTYLVGLKDSSISIKLNDYYDPNTERSFDYYIFEFRNDTGDIVESVSIGEFDENRQRSEEFVKAGKIYNLARNQSLKVDKTLDRILEQLAI